MMSEEIKSNYPNILDNEELDFFSNMLFENSNYTQDIPTLNKDKIEFFTNDGNFVFEVVLSIFLSLVF
jgi:hypothetical protein